MSLRGSRFGLDGLEDEIGRVNLAMRMRIGNAYNLAFVFEYQDVIYLFMRAEFDVLLLPGAHQVDDLRVFEFRECQVMARTVADDARNACRGPVSENPLRRI